jgi:hypothetical protein
MAGGAPSSLSTVIAAALEWSRAFMMQRCAVRGHLGFLGRQFGRQQAAWAFQVRHGLVLLARAVRITAHRSDWNAVSAASAVNESTVTPCCWPGRYRQKEGGATAADPWVASMQPEQPLRRGQQATEQSSCPRSDQIHDKYPYHDAGKLPPKGVGSKLRWKRPLESRACKRREEQRPLPMTNKSSHLAARTPLWSDGWLGLSEQGRATGLGREERAEMLTRFRAP